MFIHIHVVNKYIPIVNNNIPRVQYDKFSTIRLEIQVDLYSNMFINNISNMFGIIY